MAIVSVIHRRIPWAGVLATTGLFGIVGIQLRQCIRLTGGRLVYMLDDPYIHMALAKMLATCGTWGITPGRFEPASSSPAWTLLIAGLDRLFGVSDATPLVVCLMAGCAALLVLDHVLEPAIGRMGPRAALILAIAFLIPLPALVFSGMETILHVLLALAVSWGFAGWLLGPRPAGRARGAALFALSALAVLTRFESLFLVASLALIALLHRRLALAAVLVGGACLAAGGYAWLSIAHGGLWLPNPVLLDSHAPDLASPATWGPFIRRIPTVLANPRRWHVVALLAAAGWVLLRRPGTVADRARGPRLLVGVFVLATLLHVLFAELGGYFRYEAYLVAVGLSAITACAAGARVERPGERGTRGRVARTALTVLAGLLVAAPLVTRAALAMQLTPRAVKNIYEQQIQMSRFVHEHFRGQCVAINDLGAVGYYGDARVVDLVGLATIEVARANLSKRFDTVFIERLCAAKGVRVALLYDAWFVGAAALPPSWHRIARWTIHDNVVAGDPTVTIFALTSKSADSVRAAARAFAESLPKSVKQEILD